MTVTVAATPPSLSLNCMSLSFTAAVTEGAACQRIPAQA